MGGEGRRRPEDSCECRQTTLGNEVGRLGDGGNLLLQAFPREVALPEEGGVAPGAEILAQVSRHGAAAGEDRGAELGCDAAVAIVEVQVPTLQAVGDDAERGSDGDHDATVALDLGADLDQVVIVDRQALDVHTAAGEEVGQKRLLGDHAPVVEHAGAQVEESLLLQRLGHDGRNAGLEVDDCRLEAEVIDRDADVEHEVQVGDPVHVPHSAAAVGGGGVLVEIELADDREIGGGRNNLGVDVREAGVDLREAHHVREQRIGLGDDLLQPSDVRDAGLAIHGADHHVLEGLEVAATLLHDLADLPTETLLLHPIWAVAVASANAHPDLLLHRRAVGEEAEESGLAQELARIVSEAGVVERENVQPRHLDQGVVGAGVGEVLDGRDDAVTGVIELGVAAGAIPDAVDGVLGEELTHFELSLSSHGVLLGTRNGNIGNRHSCRSWHAIFGNSSEMDDHRPSHCSGSGT